MGENTIKLKVMIEVGPEVDSEKIEQFTYELRRELMNQDVDLVEIPESKEPLPEGAKAAGIAGVGTLLVTLLPSALSNVVECANNWVNNKNSGEIVMEFNGQKLQLKGLSSPERQKIAYEFIRVATQKVCTG